MSTPHLSDDRLVEIYFTETPSAQEQQHLGACHDCDARHSHIAHLLDETTLAAHEDVEAAFPAERLARQQLQILERAEMAAGPARVISFPTVQSAGTTVSTRSRSTRWVAAAAVAGLLVGVAAGRAGRDFRTSGTRARFTAPVSQTTPQVIRVTAPISDDQFLSEIESAIESRGGGSLHALEELTPRAWDQ
jgi:hypothetical protein